MESCISSSKIEFDRIDEPTKNKIVSQLGSDEAAEYLCSRLTIQHSDGDYHATCRGVREELLKFSDYAGVELLVRRTTSPRFSDGTETIAS
jgi:hypothetical protein